MEQKGIFQSSKTFDNFSVAIRQWKAQHSHCQLLHGYAISFKVWFEPINPMSLDEMNWVVDFGIFSRNGLREWLDDMFDHTLLIEKDDPYLDIFQQSQVMGLAKLRVMEKMGAENLAKLVFDKFNDVFSKTEGGRVKVVKVECFENDKNSAIYKEQ